MLSTAALNRNNLYKTHDPIFFFASDVYSNVTIVNSKFLTIPAFLTLSINRDEENIREKKYFKKFKSSL